MKGRIFTGIVSFGLPALLGSLLVTSAPSHSQSPPQAAIDASALIEQIKSEIQESRKLKTKPTLTIKSVKVNLKAVAERSADGSLKMVIPIIPVNWSGELAKATTQELSLSFKPEGAADIGAQSSLGLADAINAAKIVMQTAMSSEPRFKLDDMSYDADFLVKADGKGGFSFWVFDVGAGFSNASTQHISVELLPTD